MAYTIQKGDTLSKIAKQNKTTIEELLKLNPYITDPNKISAGKTLALPTDNSGTPSAQTPAQTPTATTPIVSNPYDTILKDLEEAYRRQTEAHEASTGALLSELETGKQTIAQQAYDSTRAASGNYAQAQRVLPEQMARLGLYGTGASETSLVNLGNAYRTTLGDINLAKTQGLQNIDTQKSNVQTQAQQIISSAYSDYINSRANVLLQSQQERLTKEGWARDERLTKEGWARDEKMTRAGWAQQEKMARASAKSEPVQSDWSRIIADIKSGELISKSELDSVIYELGLDDDRANALYSIANSAREEMGLSKIQRTPTPKANPMAGMDITGKYNGKYYIDGQEVSEAEYRRQILGLG